MELILYTVLKLISYVIFLTVAFFVPMAIIAILIGMLYGVWLVYGPEKWVNLGSGSSER